MDVNHEQASHPRPQRRAYPLLHSIANFYPLFLRQPALTKLIILTPLLLFLHAACEDPSQLHFTQHEAAVFVVKTICSVACVGLVLGISAYLDRHHHRSSKGNTLYHSGETDKPQARHTDSDGIHIRASNLSTPTHRRPHHPNTYTTPIPIPGSLFVPRHTDNEVGHTPHHSSGILGPSPQSRICKSKSNMARESEMQFLNGKNAGPQFKHFSGSGFREAWVKKTGALI